MGLPSSAWLASQRRHQGDRHGDADAKAAGRTAEQLIGEIWRPAEPSGARRQFEGRGVSFAGEHDTGVCRMAFFRDSEGNSLMLHRRYAP